MAADPTYVLTLPAVRWAIDELRGSKIHPFFLAYLQLRKNAAEEGGGVIVPHWDELGDLLSVAGGPPGKPYYRPFWHGDVDDPGRYWLNRNIAGSYAPSSVRAVPRQVVDIIDGEYSLKPNHAELAVEHLLYGEQVSAIALAAFFYRDYGFTAAPPGAPSPFDLPPVLRDDFRFGGDDDFALLFHDGIPQVDFSWFEPFADEPEWE